MTTTERAQVRSQARVMTLAELRHAWALSIQTFARATTPEAAQYAHDLAGEYAEAYQRAAHPAAWGQP